MPASDGFLDMLCDLMAPVGVITARRMFGGASLYADGLIFAIVVDDSLYLKGDANTAQRYDAEGLSKFAYEGKNGPVEMSYWRAPERLIDNPEELCEWAQEAILVGRTAAGGKRQSAAKSPPKTKKPRARKR